MSGSEDRPANFIHDGTKSTQEAYYEYMLRKEKLNAVADKGVADGWLRADEKTALSEVGEKDKLELKILARLYGLADSSAELLQVKTLTGCKTREECARELSDIHYRKITTDEVLNRFVAPNNAKTQIFTKAAAASRNNYSVWGSNL